MAAFGKTISLFLIEGDPNRRWVCELSNWNGKAYKIPRVEVKNCDDRQDLRGCGIYFLFGKDDTTEQDVVYIGEAENILERLKQHDAPTGKEFWTECIVFISKDNRLNKAHIKHLERACYLLAKQVGRYKLDNASVPADASLTEAETAEMDEFLYNVKLLMNTLGHKVLESLVDGDTDDLLHQKRYQIHAARGANAIGIQTSDGLVVLKGSVAASSETASCPDSIRKLRAKLLSQGIIDSDWTFVADRAFSSFSIAAGVVMGRSANGLLEWREISEKSR